jgi:hypothetical protein
MLRFCHKQQKQLNIKLKLYNYAVGSLPIYACVVFVSTRWQQQQQQYAPA